MDIMEKALNSQITFLKNVNASFKIKLPNGQFFEHDPNNFFAPEKKLKRHRRNPGIKLGEVTDFVNPLLAPLEPGQYVDIPHKFHVETLRCVVGAYATRTWGKGSYLTQNKPGTDYMTVVRIL
jgi:hypothetical protein